MVVKKILKKNSDKKMLEFVKQSLLDDKVINLKIIDVEKLHRKMNLLLLINVSISDLLGLGCVFKKSLTIS